MLVLKSSSPYSLRVTILLGTMVLDGDMVRSTVEELAHASDTWWQAYMSKLVTAKVASIVEMKDDGLPTTDAPLLTTWPILIPPFGCKWVKGLVKLLPVHSYQVHVIAELMENHWLTQGVMATSTYGGLHPGSRRVAMMLWNLSAWEVRIPPKTICADCWHSSQYEGLWAYQWGPSFEGAKKTVRGQPVFLLKFPWKWVDRATPYISAVGAECSDLGTWHVGKSGSIGVHRMRPWGPTGSEENFGRICGC